MAGISTVPVYGPQISVVLYKTIGRTTLDGKIPTSERFRGTGGRGAPAGLNGGSALLGACCRLHRRWSGASRSADSELAAEQAPPIP
jgi:hypothetical protein